MSDIQVFNNEEFGTIRIVDVNGEPAFCLADLCQVLDLPSNVVRQRLDDGVCSKYPISDSLGRTQHANFVNEDGLYDVILDSRKPEAKKFRKWVTSEVLPTIRKHGMYATENTIDNILNNPDFGIRLLQTLKEEREAKKALEIENKKQGEQIALMQDTIKEMEGKVSYLDKIFACPSTVKVKVIAQDYGMSAIAFNQLLHSMGIQYKDGKNWILYRRYIDKGYVKDVPFEYERKDGTKAVKSNTQWTQKGRAFLYEFLKSNLILPLIEQ